MNWTKTEIQGIRATVSVPQIIHVWPSQFSITYGVLLSSTTTV